ncbi:hypothetical protein AU252_20380 [Pseudarthrobacter sulfonivorans]|uniref:Uncharacterized protein n=1 Tax=Pseudarthrobacter sulfonivorans TaxID=121292 RepID=A0A0U3FHS5_9MICC|nr:hypothetical protein AU252_20380 [Pseudarthrobacter sulfonivorans]
MRLENADDMFEGPTGTQEAAKLLVSFSPSVGQIGSVSSVGRVSLAEFLGLSITILTYRTHKLLATLVDALDGAPTDPFEKVCPHYALILLVL